MPGLHIAGSNVPGKVAGFSQRCAESRSGDEVRTVTLHGWTEARSQLHIGRADWVQDRLRDGGIDDVGSVIGKQVFAALAIELNVVDPIASADHSLGVPSVGKTKTRSEVALRDVDHRPVGYSAVGRLLQSAGSDL